MQLAPNKLLFDIMHVTDVILMIAFFASLHWAINKGKGLILGPALFLVANVIELFVALFFPLDAGGEIITLTGRIHVILVMLMGFLAMFGMLVMWRRLKKVDEWKGYDIYSLITFIVTFVFGLAAASSVGSEIMGLTERLVVCSIGQYFFVIALKTYLTSE